MITSQLHEYITMLVQEELEKHKLEAQQNPKPKPAEADAEADAEEEEALEEVSDEELEDHFWQDMKSVLLAEVCAGTKAWGVTLQHEPPSVLQTSCSLLTGALCRPGDRWVRQGA